MAILYRITFASSIFSPSILYLIQSCSSDLSQYRTVISLLQRIYDMLLLAMSCTLAHVSLAF